jgi:hypothetical protein
MVALVWPGALSGVLDGAPLQGPAEAVLIGLVVPVLIWLHPAFLGRTLARVAIAAILFIKIGAAVTLQQEGWCIAFEPPYPMVRDSTGKPHAWDLRADWLADDPVCSAIMTRSYHDAFELPAWFYNLPPPGDAVVRDGFHPGEIPVRVRGYGFITAPRHGALQLQTAPMMSVSAAIDGHPMEVKEPGRHEVRLEPGAHAIQFEGTLLGKDWRVIPAWEGVEMGSMRFPSATVGPPSRVDRAARPALNWILAALIAAVIAAWLIRAIGSVGDGWLLAWSGAAAVAAVVVATWLPGQAAWYAAGAIGLSVLVVVRPRFMNARGLFFLIIVPWLAFTCAANALLIGRWSLYGIGNDNFHFQRFSYRIFLQHFWLEGGQLTFWNQPLFRWIAGVLHLVFGDSSVGQVYWDAAGVAIIAMFAYRVVAPLKGFAWGLLAAILPLAMFLLGPGLEFVGFGLSEISSAAFIYLAIFFAMRSRGPADLVAAGVLVVLGVYTRLNNLPMAVAVAAFALPVATPAVAAWRPRVWLPQVRWRVVVAIGGALAIGGVLFAWRTWYFTGVFSLFHGTQREFLAVWKPDMHWQQGVRAMGSSVMMVLTGQDPARFAWQTAPLLGGAFVAAAALLGMPVFRAAPLPVVAFFAAGCAGALVTRGWGFEGRFSIHLYGAASALCAWGLASMRQARIIRQ